MMCFKVNVSDDQLGSDELLNASVEAPATCILRKIKAVIVFYNNIWH